MNKICNYPNQDDYETEEEYNQALEWYWMELDRQYDEWKDDDNFIRDVMYFLDNVLQDFINNCGEDVEYAPLLNWRDSLESRPEPEASV